MNALTEMRIHTTSPWTRGVFETPGFVNIVFLVSSTLPRKPPLLAVSILAFHLRSAMAVYVVQADEIPSFKELRTLVDKKLMSREPLLTRSTLYFDFFPTNEGVDKYLRPLLFPNSLKCKSGVKAAPVDTSAGIRPRGRPRKGTVRTPNEVKAAEEARQLSNRKNQRQAKSKERTENRLLSLSFSAMYEITSRGCRFTAGAPPLKVITRNEKGRNRRVTNYEKVRGFLRRVMTNWISSHAKGTRAITDMAAIQAALLPAAFIPIARRFLAMKVLHEEDGSSSSNGPASAVETRNDSVESALETLQECFDALIEYVADWWRRNLTSDVELPYASCFNRNNPLVSACEALLRAMVKVIPPSSPSLPLFRSQFLYGMRIGGTVPCCEHSKKCLICTFGSSEDNEVSQTILDECHDYVNALQACCAFTRRITPQGMEEVLSKPVSPEHSAVWKHAYAHKALHRLGVLSCSLKTSSQGADRSDQVNSREFVQSVRSHAGSLWVALHTSNHEVLKLLEGGPAE